MARWTRFRAIWLLSAILFSCGAATTVNADQIPGFGFAPYYYYSVDMSSVEVSFARIFYNNDTAKTYKIGHTDPSTGKFVEGAPITTATLARAYIVGLSDYTTGDTSYHHFDFVKSILPDKIAGNGLQVLMTHPQGLPYSIVYNEWPKHKPDLTELGAGKDVANWNDREDQIRALTLWATITAADGQDSRRSALFDPTRSVLAKEHLGTYEGFERYNRLVKSEAFFDNSADEIRFISCSRPLEKARPKVFCSYWFPLNSELLVELKFIDFRVHGGRKFARERIRAFKRAMCDIFKCDERALKAATYESVSAGGGCHYAPGNGCITGADPALFRKKASCPLVRSMNSPAKTGSGLGGL